MKPPPPADKSLGQHFLHDVNAIKTITNLPAKVEAIVEVGPGRGALTRHLAEHPLPLYLIEKDHRFAPFLTPLTSKERIYFQDALNMDWNHLLHPYQRVWLVSNLPYNVGVPLTRQFLRCPSLSPMTLMFQREVADKMLKLPMNSLMALVQNYCSCRRLIRVPAGAFSPPPQVDSTVVELIRLPSPVIPLEHFDRYEHFLRQLFNQKRKQVQKILRHMYSADRGESALEKISLDGSRRAESFNLAQVQLLYKELES